MKQINIIPEKYLLLFNESYFWRVNVFWMGIKREISIAYKKVGGFMETLS